MKGISTVIATLLMLVITVALAITAYSYINGLFTSQTTKNTELVDSGCNPGVAYFLTVRSLDNFNNISTSSFTVRVDNSPATVVWNDFNGLLTTGNQTSGTIVCSSPGCAAGTFHTIRFVGPSGQPASNKIAC